MKVSQMKRGDVIERTETENVSAREITRTAETENSRTADGVQNEIRKRRNTRISEKIEPTKAGCSGAERTAKRTTRLSEIGETSIGEAVSFSIPLGGLTPITLCPHCQMANANTAKAEITFSLTAKSAIVTVV